MILVKLRQIFFLIYSFNLFKSFVNVIVVF